MNATSTLYLVPPRTDRIREGRILAAELLGDDPGDRALARRGIHPDLIELLPPAGKERVGIEPVRGAIRSAQFAPVQASRKVCLIPFAERLTPEAANALLKTLEEPPRDMAFVLLASHPAELLPTIVSRSRLIRLPPRDRKKEIERLRSAGYTEAEWLAGIADRDGEIDRLIDDRIDIEAARDEAEREMEKADAKGLIDAALSDRPILRHTALKSIIARSVKRDPELLSAGVRHLAGRKREAVFLFLQELLSVAFTMIRERIDGEADQDGISLSYLRELAVRLDTAHRAMTAYTPIEGALLFALLGGETDAV